MVPNSVCFCVAGTIPSEFCNIEGISIDVTASGIECYSGCLTSAAVQVQGASPVCHDGSIMLRFIIFVSIWTGIVLVMTLVYRDHRGKTLQGADPSPANPISWARSTATTDTTL
jgi:hypothetical protein